jgi:GR25 family glycosyltransferase involved in LPS biosynthesis
VWSESFVKSFELFGPAHARGAAKAWLAHIDVLKFIILNGWGSALVLEDDVDWSVQIREQTRKVAKAIVELTEQKAGLETPYGLDWDVIWMGHCGDPPEFKKVRHVTYKDPTVPPFEKYRNINKHVITQLKQGRRAVHFSVGPICTWAYAVSANGAHKLLAEALEGRDDAYDLMLMNKCKSEKLRCITVNMELFDQYIPAEGEQSEVRAGNSGADLEAESLSSRSMGHTDNVLESARCAGLYNSTCM